MVRLWTTLAVTLCTAALLTVGAAVSAAQEGKDTPLARLMRKVEDQTKVIRDGVKTAPRFRKAAKEIATSAHALAQLGQETRPFTEPAQEFKKPQEYWNQLTDGFIEASQAMAKAADASDFITARKVWISLNNTCTNCHGAFRPSTEDEPF